MFNRKKWLIDNKKKIAKQKRKWYEDNLERVKKYSKDYYYQYQEKHKKQARERQRLLSQFIANYKLEKGCHVCGYNKCVRALDFHHPNDDKSYNIGEYSKSTSLDKLKREIEKCVVLCRNCHAELHEREEVIAKYKKGEIDKEKHTWAK